MMLVRRLACLALLGGMIPLALPAQTNPPAPAATELQTDVSAQLAADLEASGLTAEARAPLEEALGKARTLVERTGEYSRRLADLELRVRDSADLQAALADRAARLPPEEIDLPQPTAQADVGAVEALLAQEQALLIALPAGSGSPGGADTEAPAALAEGIAALTTELAKSVQAVQADTTADSPTLADRIQQWLAACQRRRLQSELAVLQYQLDHKSELDTVAAAERQLSARESRIRTARVARLRDWLEQARTSQSSQVRISTEEAERAADTLPAGLRAFAQATAELGRELERTTQEEITTNQRTEELKTRRADMEQERDVLGRRFEAVGSSATMGKLLLQRWVEIRDHAWMDYTRRNGRERVGEIINRRLDLDVDAQDPSLDERLDAALRAQVASEDPPVDDQTVEALVGSRVEVVQALALAYRRLDTAIAQLQIAGKATQDEARRLSESVEQWLMWTRTAPTLTPSEVLQWPSMVVRHFEAILREIPTWASSIWQGRRAPFLLGLLILLPLVALRPRIGRRMADLDRRVAKIRTDRFHYTLEALGWTAVRALPLPGLFCLLGYALFDSQAASSFHSVSRPLYMTAATLFYLLFLAESARPGGLGPRHLRWSKAACVHLRREFRWLIPTFAGLQFVGSLTVILPQSFAEPVMRLYLLLLLGVTAAAALYLLRTKSHWYQQQAIRDRPSLFVRWRVIWRALVIILSGALAYLFILGYGFSAVRFFEMILYSQFVAVGMVYLRELSIRAVSVPERRLRFQKQVQKLTEARRQDSPAEEPGELPAEVEEAEVDFSQLGEKARRLINGTVLLLVVVAMVQLWRQYLPLVNALDEVTLPISKTILVSGQEQVVPLNLADLLTALAIAFMVAVAATNLPALVEITVLQQLPMDQGARYAIVTLLQYAIVGLGVASVFTHLGFSWSSIRWLAAALSVGLGFGLQEIVANFVSGIIILFERPVRVGDVVTMGDTTGIVSRIRIRATTVVNWDKQELLIPNKEFITGRLLNWTLSDKLNRIVIPIGVAYGTDTRRALRVAREIVEAHPQILTDPKPLFTFEGFGDSSLNLIVRCYLGSLDGRLEAITDLHTRIHEQFMAEGIEIAFPQLDVHWKNPPPR